MSSEIFDRKKKPGEIPSCQVKIGIGKYSDNDLCFENLIIKKLSSADILSKHGVHSSYNIYPELSTGEEKTLKKLLGGKNYQEMLKTLKNIQNRANAKRDRIGALLFRGNPFLSYRDKLRVFIRYSIQLPFTSCCISSNCCVQFVKFIAIVIGVYFGGFIWVVLYILALLLDLITGRYKSNPSEKEINFIKGILDNNSELDANAIDTTVCMEMKVFVKEVSSWISTANAHNDMSDDLPKDVRVFIGVERLDEDFGIDVFLLLFGVEKVMAGELIASDVHVEV